MAQLDRALAVALITFTWSTTARAQQPAVIAGARDPLYAPDGRLAISVRGDLWVVSPSGRWTRVTSGPSWDRQPTWSLDGRSLIYSSNDGLGQTFRLRQVELGAAHEAASPSLPQATAGANDEEEPAVLRAADGRAVIAFVRGHGSAARIWLREPDGRERRLTNGSAAERWPSASPDGGRIAYVSITESGRRLVVHHLAAAANERATDSTVATMAEIEHPAWSPDGKRLTFTTGGARPGVYVVPTDGRYVNLLAPRHAASAWSPDGKRVLLVDLPEDDVPYNGDPDRTGDRDADNLLAAGGELRFVAAPAPPDSGVPEVAIGGAPAAGVTDRGAYNAAAFDQLWARIAKLYYDTTLAPDRRAAWEALRARYRPRAIAATNEEELRTTLHDMLHQRPSYRLPATGRAAISSANPVATAAGLEILRKGGNAVDAAAAVSFALGVVEPDASGPGGYGQMLVYRKGMATPQLIEFMSRVPEDASLANADLLRNGRLPDDGPVLANVPGTVAAMYLAWRKYGSGKVAWADVLAPAIRAASDGFVVSDGLATTLATERRHFLKYEGSRALFFRDGEPRQAGDTIRNPDLAWTLEQVARGGADAFYRGEIARRIVTDLRGKGNAMKLVDMERYFAAERAPVSGTYRGYTLYSSAPPVSGGAELVATLNLLENYHAPRSYTEDAGTLNAMLSAWLLAPSARGRIADPGLWPVALEPFTSKDTARARWRCFHDDHAPSLELLRGDSLACEGAHATPTVSGGEERFSAVLRALPGDSATDCGEAAGPLAPRVCHSAGTTAFTVADADGDVVAVTQTLGTWGGNFYVTPGLGFLYNDKLASYGTDPDAYGARLPYARHGSTIAPTIVFAGRGGRQHPIAAVGAAGNAWITAAVYQTLIGILDEHLDPQAALEQPRFLLGFRGAADRTITVQMEDGFSPAVMQRLQAMGYRPQLVSLMGELREGYGAALTIDDGTVTAGADPRRSGAAGAIPREGGGR